jgi:secreted PhoX family phosphatase
LVPLRFDSAGAVTARAGDSPYGKLLGPNDIGIMVPDGFAVREIARHGVEVGRSGYTWHRRPDGGATFPTDDDGWVYVSNSEVSDRGKGGVGALRFNRDGELVDAYSICQGTTNNCAGGPTPWGAWLTCEEIDRGQVWECDPTGKRPAVVRPALGALQHEAAAVDPDNRHIYLSEDDGDGRFYRFVSDNWPSLERGRLEVAAVADDGAVRWLRVPDPSGRSRRTREQVGESQRFRRGEGLWFQSGKVYLSTTGDGRVWVYDTDKETIEALYDPETFSNPPLKNPDNLTASGNGDVFVAEDIDESQDIVLITAEGVAASFLRLTGQGGSEITGPAFDPSGSRLYFSSQKGGDGGGATYEVTGPFRELSNGSPATANTVTTIADRFSSLNERNTRASGDEDGGGGVPLLPVVGGLGAALAVGFGLGWRLRRRNPAPVTDETTDVD